jgi:hypothetical protein
LKILSARIESSKRSTWTVFEPTLTFYRRLESGDDNDLEMAADEIGRHLEILTLPYVTYEWGLKMKPEVAGQIKYGGGLRSQIQIPLYYVGKPDALGGILAHELTHEFLALQNIKSTNMDETEPLTDLTSIALGLGKLVLNGTVSALLPSTGESHILGYLSPELKVYAFMQVNQQHKIPKEKLTENFTENALKLLRTYT